MKSVFALAIVALLAGCGSADPEPGQTPTPTPTLVGPRTLVATAFEGQELGPKIAGPQGPEVSGKLTFDGQDIADIVSYVACPAARQQTEGEPAPVSDGSASAAEASAAVCSPDAQAEGTTYTYVHRVTPVGGANGPVVSFGTSRPVNGFANVLGFDRRQAEAALGEGYIIRAQVDNGAIIWRIEKGNGWDAGEEMTFFWESTVPPEGPAEAYEVETSMGRASGNGPFPPAAMPEDTAQPASAD